MKKIFAISICILFLVSCNGNKNDKNDTKDTVKKVKVNVPDFNADSAFAFTEKQVSFGPRVSGTKNHKLCGDWIVSKFKMYTKDVIEQTGQMPAFDGRMLPVRNLIASFKPDAQNRILLCAHWDTRPYADMDTKDENRPIDGADDGASGVGVLIEIARVLSKTLPSVGVDIILFDTEDYGPSRNSKYESKDEFWCLGSQYWSRNKHKQGYTASYGILLDMVGAKNATFYKEGRSMEYAGGIVNKVWGAAARLGYGSFFLTDREGQMAITDDHIFVNELGKIPCIDIVHLDPSTKTGFAAHWHTHNDTMQNIDKATLQAVGATLMDVIFKEGVES
ncbi:MAG: M28 family peptidase [Bacteroidota bacterium]